MAGHPDVAVALPSRHRAVPSSPTAMVAPLAVAALSVAGLALVGLVDPHTPGRYPTCPLLWLTGLYCPGCGSLRALHDLVHLDLAGAWGMNPLLLLVLPYLVGSWGSWARRRLVGAPRRRLARPVWIWLALVGVLAYAIMRNIPVLEPWLAP